MMNAVRKARSDRIRTAIARAVLPLLAPGEHVPSSQIIARACRISNHSAIMFLRQVLENAGVTVRLHTLPGAGRGMVVMSIPGEDPAAPTEQNT